MMLNASSKPCLKIICMSAGKETGSNGIRCTSLITV